MALPLMWPALSAAAPQKSPQGRPAATTYRDVKFIPVKPKPKLKNMPAPAPSNHYAAPGGTPGQPWAI